MFFFGFGINTYLNCVTLSFKIHYLQRIRNSIVDSFLQFAGLKALEYCQTSPEIRLVKGKDCTVVLTVK